MVDKLTNSLPVNCLDELLAIVAEVKAHLPLLGETLTDLVAALQSVLEDCGTMTMTAAQEEQALPRLIHHRDWEEARRAALRAALTIGVGGGIWALTGWSKGPLMLIAISIMISIFSTKEHPAGFVGQIFIGAAIGSTCAVFCRLVLMPGETDPFLTIAIIAPFVLIGFFAIQQRRTAIAATDATLFFLFVSQPGVSIAVLPEDLAIGAVTMVMGVGSAWLAYRYLMPINPARRMRSLLSAIMRDIELLVTVTSQSAARRLRARLHHRVIRLVAMATRHDADHRATVAAGVSALAIAGSIKQLREVLDRGGLAPATVSMIRAALASLADLGRQPDNAPQVLDAAANRLYTILDGDHPPSGPSRNFPEELARKNISWMPAGT